MGDSKDDHAPISVRVPKAVRDFIMSDLRSEKRLEGKLEWKEVWQRAMKLYHAVAETRAQGSTLFFSRENGNQNPKDRIEWIATLTVSFKSASFNKQVEAVENSEGSDAFKFGNEGDFPKNINEKTTELLDKIEHLKDAKPTLYVVRQSSLYMLFQYGIRENEGLCLFRESSNKKTIERFNLVGGCFERFSPPEAGIPPNQITEDTVAGPTRQKGRHASQKACEISNTDDPFDSMLDGLLQNEDSNIPEYQVEVGA
jgi:hypothetical protein